MKAAILHEVNQPLQIEEVDIDRPGPREVLIRTGATGVCHSDLHFIEGTYSWPLPVILGHEAAGTVEAVGDQVSYVKPGGRVITCLSVFCGHCDKCLSGRPVLCSKTDVVRSPDDPPRLRQGDTEINQFAHISSFAEKMLVHEHATVKVRDDVPVEVLALIGCGVTTGLGAALNTARVEPGSTVVVIGCGGGAAGHRRRRRGDEAQDGSRVWCNRRDRRLWWGRRRQGEEPHRRRCGVFIRGDRHQGDRRAGL